MPNDILRNQQAQNEQQAKLELDEKNKKEKEEELQKQLWAAYKQRCSRLSQIPTIQLNPNERGIAALVNHLAELDINGIATKMVIVLTGEWIKILTGQPFFVLWIQYEDELRRENSCAYTNQQLYHLTYKDGKQVPDFSQPISAQEWSDARLDHDFIRANGYIPYSPIGTLIDALKLQGASLTFLMSGPDALNQPQRDLLFNEHLKPSPNHNKASEDDLLKTRMILERKKVAARP